MRICRWCGFFFEGTRKIHTCPECKQENDGGHAFSVGAGNANHQDLILAVPHLIAAVNNLQKQVASLKSEIDSLKGGRR